MNEKNEIILTNYEIGLIREAIQYYLKNCKYIQDEKIYNEIDTKLLYAGQ